MVLSTSILTDSQQGLRSLDPLDTYQDMRILLINPNSTKDITRTLAAALPRYEDVVLHTLDAPVPAPAAIQSAVTSIASAFYSFKAILPTLAEYDGFLVCCYSAHPLVEMLRESTTAPVVGIMQASLVTGLQLGNKVGIVTTADRVSAHP